MVTVFCWTYNHVNYVRQSIESILYQRTNFKVEIIVHDDASSDGTSEIIKEIEQQYPDLFSNILHVENQWSLGNSVMIPLFTKSTGKYVALSHGDDYWSDPYKLQKQIDFLESNAEYSICFCATTIENNTSNEILRYPAYVEHVSGKKRAGEIETPAEITTTEELAIRNYIHTPSVVYRNTFISETYPDYLIQVPIGDWPLYMHLSRYGKIKFLRDSMAVYRVHGGGVYSTLNTDKTALSQLKVYAYMITSGFFEPKYCDIWKDNSRQAMRDLLSRYNADDKTKWLPLFELYANNMPDFFLEFCVDLCKERKELKRQLLAGGNTSDNRIKYLIKRIFKI